MYYFKSMSYTHKSKNYSMNKRYQQGPKAKVTECTTAFTDNTKQSVVHQF